MRELSRLELQFASGGSRPAYAAHELSTLAATTGYSIGTIINGIRNRSYRSSVTGIAGAISLCDKSAKATHDALSMFVRVGTSINLVFNFFCGIHMGFSERVPKGDKAD